MSESPSSQVVRAAISRWTEPVCGLAGLILLAVALFFVARGWVPRERPHPSPEEIGALAVLPFDPIGNQGSGGLSQKALLRALVAEFSDHLDVVPPERSLVFEGSRKTLREIAEEVGADSVLVGSIIAAESGTRVRARLVHAADSRELFAVRVLGEDPQQIAQEMTVTILGKPHP